MSKIPDNILSVLGECRVEGNTLFLPEGQLDRPVYQAVNKVLENIGGKWNRKAQGHVFADGDLADLLDAVLLTGETIDLKKQFQFFPTPRPVAEKMCELAELDDTCIVLEPSCGKGDLADVIYEAGVKELIGVELNPDMKKHLDSKPYTTLTGLDFLEFANDPNIRSPWTRIVMNPPFSRQQDIDHILTAYNILAPGGILVSIVSESPFFRQNKKSADFRELLDKHEAEIIPLDEGAFKKSGTMVRTRIIKMRKEGQPVPNSTPEAEQKPAATDVTQSITGSEILMIPTSMLFPHPDNPRKDVGDISELADSIRVNGILQNLTVVPRGGGGYTVIIGHRRLAASKRAGIEEVPCVIAKMTPTEQVKTMLMENIQRSDLTVYEQAQGFQMMLDMGETVESIAKDSGFSQSTVRRRVKLLDLDQEKFKKSVQRGATLTDYAELDKIEDPDLKNKVLDAIGTANFRNELKSAIEEDKLKKRMAAWRTGIEAFATEIEKRDYIGEEYTPMDYVRNYGRWSGSVDVERPEDADTVRYYFRAAKDQFDLYKDHQEREETEEDRLRNAEREALERKKSELCEITERHFSLRSEFISEFGQTKKHMAEICGFAAEVVVGDGGWSRDEVNIELLDELLDLDIDIENDSYDELRQAVAKSAVQAPEYTLLACVYASVDEKNNKYWSTEWSQENLRYMLVYSGNEDLDRLYDFLMALGYEMSDEEKAMQNGNCPLLDTYKECRQ